MKLIKKTFYSFFLVSMLFLSACSSPSATQADEETAEKYNLIIQKKTITVNYNFKEKIDGYAFDLMDSYSDLDHVIDFSKDPEAYEALEAMIAHDENFKPYGDYYDYAIDYLKTYAYFTGATDTSCKEDRLPLYSFQKAEACKMTPTGYLSSDPSGVFAQIKSAKGRLGMSENVSGQNGSVDFKDYCVDFSVLCYYKVYMNIFNNNSIDSGMKSITTCNADNMQNCVFGTSPYNKYFDVHQFDPETFEKNPAGELDRFREVCRSGSFLTRTSPGWMHIMFIDGLDVSNDTIFQSEGAVTRGTGSFHGVFMHSQYDLEQYLRYQFKSPWSTTAGSIFLIVPKREIAPFPGSVLSCDYLGPTLCSTITNDEALKYQNQGSPGKTGSGTQAADWAYWGRIR